jgi:hypothetical protein
MNEQDATMIWTTAKDCLETLDIMDLPKVEEGDFRASLEHIMELAVKLGADVYVPGS